MNGGGISSSNIAIENFGIIDTVGKNTKAIKEYIAGLLEEDKLGEQLRIDYPENPFS